ncbi:MAG: lysylphosphatidylglycerol synthase domain-containing protein [Gemmatimonadaceae bacterium]
MPPPRRNLLRLAQWALAVAVLGFAIAELVRQWDAVRAAAIAAELHWGLLAASCAVVLLTYALLVEAWRAMVAGFGDTLAYRDAARIWFISNLGKYVPGKVWQLGTMAVMARQRGVSPVAAAGSALVVTLINTAAGFAVVILSGVAVVELPAAAVIAIGVLGTLLLLSPQIVPRVAAVVGRFTGRALPLRPPSTRAVWFAAAASALAWVTYGLAFYLLARGVGVPATGGPGLYIAVFAGSYLLGFLTLFAPGGVGVREVVMAAALTKAGMPHGPAILLVLASRLWLTALELAPAFLFLARHRPR